MKPYIRFFLVFFSVLVLALVSGTARAFDPTALLAGTSTVVQPDPNETWTFRTWITGVRYHIPGVSSEVAMSDTPIPVLRSEDGVSFYEVTGELSGVAFHWRALPLVIPIKVWPYSQLILPTKTVDLYSVFGPIDSHGVDHRHDADGTNVRAGLRGIPFVLRWPAQGWNGGLVQWETGGNGGQPSFIYMPVVDLPALLRAGWAYFSVHEGGTVGADTNPNGPEAVGEPSFWTVPSASMWKDVLKHPHPYYRFAQVGPHGSLTKGHPWDYEAAFPAYTFLGVWLFMGQGQAIRGPLPVSDPDVVLDATKPLPDPRPLNYVQRFPAPEVFRDAVQFAKNLLHAETGTTDPIWTCWLGASNGGNLGLMIDLGRRGMDTNATVSQGPPRSAGNYNVPFDPSSGVRYDAFLFHATYPEVNYAADPNDPGDFSFLYNHHDFVPDDEYPISAPTAWVVGDADLVAPSTYAAEVAWAIDHKLPGSLLADKHLGDWLTIYMVRGMNHRVPDGVFAALPEDPEEAGSALYFDDVVGLNPDGVGRRVAGALARVIEANWDKFEADDSWLRRLDHAPRSTGVYLQLLQDLRDRTEHGTPLPPSRLEARLFDDPDSIGVGTPYVRYAMPCGAMATFLDALGCAATITEDSASNFEEQPWLALDATGVDDIRSLATGTLDYSTEPLSLPDYTAALGPYLFVAAGALQHRLTDAQIEEGYTATDGRVYHYATHGAYVNAYARAVDALVEQRLFDPWMAAQAISEAARSDVLLDGGGP